MLGKLGLLAFYVFISFSLYSFLQKLNTFRKVTCLKKALQVLRQMLRGQDLHLSKPKHRNRSRDSITKYSSTRLVTGTLSFFLLAIKTRVGYF